MITTTTTSTTTSTTFTSTAATTVPLFPVILLLPDKCGKLQHTRRNQSDYVGPFFWIDLTTVTLTLGVIIHSKSKA